VSLVSVADIQAARRLAASQAALCPQKHMQGVTEKNNHNRPLFVNTHTWCHRKTAAALLFSQ